MQLQGATDLELRLYHVCLHDAESLPASEAATRIVMALSDASERLQQMRGLIREVLDNGDFCHADNQEWMQRAEAIIAHGGFRE
jgi:hypothetical protein